MKIATWNVKNFFDAGIYEDSSGRLVIQETVIAERITYFETAIKKANPDVIFLQEVQAEKALHSLAEKLSMKVFQAKKDHRGIANTVLYKESLEEVNAESVLLPSVRLPVLTQEVKGEEVTLRRELTKLTFLFRNKNVVLYGVHLKSALPLYLEGDDKTNSESYALALSRAVLHKMGEMIALRKEVDSEREKGNEVVIMGDFNESTSSTLFAVLKNSPDEKKELFDVMRDFEGERKTHLYKGNKLTFDTAIVSEGLMRKVKEVTIENKDLEDMGDLPLDNQRVESDHAMVVVEFE